MKFSPCTDNCTHQDTHCDGCGRKRDEIASMKKHVVGLVKLAKEMEYENIEEYADAVAASIKKKLGLKKQ